MQLRWLCVVATVTAATAAADPLRTGSPWPATGVEGQVFTTMCPDLQNLVHQTVASCEAACDAHSGGCSAINIDAKSGACALRACPCGVPVKTSTLTGFSAYRRTDGACPPSFARVLGAGMVLQRAPLRARVFGRAAPNAALTVELTQTGTQSSQAAAGESPAAGAGSFRATVQADARGEWACLLPATHATVVGSGAYNVSVALAASSSATAAKAVLSDVVFGDVFVCSGQSNMQEPLSVVNNASAELAAGARFTGSIRLAVVGSASSALPLRDLGAALALPWQRASPSALGANNSRSWAFFSATCWLTAVRVSEALGPDVPLGLIGSYVGGTPIESWTPGLDPNATDPQGHKSAVLYNAMVAPLSNLAVRCFLWYQGENNSFKPRRWVKYASDFPKMIRLWRQAWVNGTGQPAHAATPFGFVQIGPRDCTPDADHQGNTTHSTCYGCVRWSQTAFQYAVPNAIMPGTFMAVAADLAEGYSPVLPLAAGCVHFGDKQDVGKRLALGICKAVYGHAVADTGPMVVSARSSATGGKQNGGKLLVTFADEAGGSIELRNASGFELSFDGVQYVAAPIIAHDNVSVTLAIPTARALLVPATSSTASAVASLRYIMHDTPCANKSCAVYSSRSGLPSPPLVANLPGHAGADPVGWDMPGEDDPQQLKTDDSAAALLCPSGKPWSYEVVATGEPAPPPYAISFGAMKMELGPADGLEHFFFSQVAHLPHNYTYRRRGADGQLQPPELVDTLALSPKEMASSSVVELKVAASGDVHVIYTKQFGMGMTAEMWHAKVKTSTAAEFWLATTVSLAIEEPANEEHGANIAYAAITTNDKCTADCAARGCKAGGGDTCKACLSANRAALAGECWAHPCPNTKCFSDFAKSYCGGPPGPSPPPGPSASLHLAYYTDSGPPGMQLVYAMSADSGASWASTVVAKKGNGTLVGFAPKLLVSGKSLKIAYTHVDVGIDKGCLMLARCHLPQLQAAGAGASAGAKPCSSWKLESVSPDCVGPDHIGYDQDKGMDAALCPKGACSGKPGEVLVSFKGSCYGAPHPPCDGASGERSLRLINIQQAEPLPLRRNSSKILTNLSSSGGATALGFNNFHSPVVVYSSAAGRAQGAGAAGPYSVTIASELSPAPFSMWSQHVVEPLSFTHHAGAVQVAAVAAARKADGFKGVLVAYTRASPSGDNSSQVVVAKCADAKTP